MNKGSTTKTLLVGLLTCLALSGCSQTQDAAQQATNKAGDAAKVAANKAGDAANKAGDAAKDAANKAGDVAKDAANKAGDAADKAKDAAKDAANKAGDVAKDAANKAGEAADKAKEVAQDAADKALASAGEAFDASKKAVGEVTEASTKTFVSSVTTSVDVLQTQFEAIKAKLDPPTIEGIGKRFTSIREHIAALSKNGIKGAAEAMDGIRKEGQELTAEISKLKNSVSAQTPASPTASPTPN